MARAARHRDLLYLYYTGTRTNSPTEYDFVGGDFDAALVEYRPKSPQIAPNRLFSRLRRSVGRDSGWSRAPWDGKFLPKVVVFGVRRGTISLSTRSADTLGGPRGPRAPTTTTTPQCRVVSVVS